jgi:cysteine-rich repeat protein
VYCYQDGKRTTEECDDGNGGGSGCSSECTIENGWTCPDSAQIVIPNSIKDVCFDCQAASKAAAEKAIANGLPPPPVISYACPSGFYLGEPCGTCMPCIKGFYCMGSPSNKRLLCEAGTYADREQSFECKVCPPNSISRRGYRGAESILDCLCNGGFTLTVGTAMEEERTCQMCVDSYKAIIGPEACTACPPDSSVGPSAGATLTIHSFNSQPEYNGAAAQIKMYDTSTSKWIVVLTSDVSGFNKRPPFPLGPENMWLTDSTGARLTPTLKVHCTCNRGYHNAFITDWHVAEAKRVQKEIDAGTPMSLRYTAVMPPLTDVLCVRCKGGHYCVGGLEPEKQCALSSWAFPGSIECSPCPDHALHPSSGTPIFSSEECVCAPGYYSLNQNMPPLSCAACPRGLYKEVHGSFPKSSCLTCPPGTYAESTNATLQAECKTCSAVGEENNHLNLATIAHRLY